MYYYYYIIITYYILSSFKNIKFSFKKEKNGQFLIRMQNSLIKDRWMCHFIFLILLSGH